MVKGSKESVKLGELAQVLLREGRGVVLVVAEREVRAQSTQALQSLENRGVYRDCGVETDVEIASLTDNPALNSISNPS